MPEEDPRAPTRILSFDPLDEVMTKIHSDKSITYAITASQFVKLYDQKNLRDFSHCFIVGRGTGDNTTATFSEVIDFTRTDLTGIEDLEKMRFATGTLFSDCKLTMSQLIALYQQGHRDFQGVIITVSLDDPADFSEADFTDADFTGVTGAQLLTLNPNQRYYVTALKINEVAKFYQEGTQSFERCKIQGVLRNAELTGAEFKYCCFQDVEFVTVGLAKSTFVDCVFQEVTLNEIDARRATITARFDNTTFTGNVIADDETRIHCLEDTTPDTEKDFHLMLANDDSSFTDTNELTEKIRANKAEYDKKRSDLYQEYENMRTKWPYNRQFDAHTKYRAGINAAKQTYERERETLDKIVQRLSDIMGKVWFDATMAKTGVIMKPTPPSAMKQQKTARLFKPGKPGPPKTPNEGEKSKSLPRKKVRFENKGP